MEITTLAFLNHEVFIFEILNERMAGSPPLTLPERVILSLYYGQLFGLNRTWAIDHKNQFFPQENLSEWAECFGVFLTHNRPNILIYEVVRFDFEFALNKLPELSTDKERRRDIVDAIGEHLFTYYLWETFPLTGEGGLLNRFYDGTSADKVRWANLFNHIGHTLRNTAKQLDQKLKIRVAAFFNWRLEQKDPEELSKFTFWMQAECLDAKWRLESLSKVLDISKSKSRDIFFYLEAFQALLEDYLDLTVECFAKLTDHISSDEYFHISKKEALPVLRAGLSNENDEVRANAERARENLLRAGRFEFMEIDEA